MLSKWCGPTPRTDGRLSTIVVNWGTAGILLDLPLKASRRVGVPATQTATSEPRPHQADATNTHAATLRGRGQTREHHRGAPA